MDTISFTNTGITKSCVKHPNLLTDWHDALVGISPRTTQQLPQIVTFVVEVSGHFSCLEFILSLSHRYCRGNFGRVISRITRDLLLLKRYLFLVPGITRDSRDNSSFKNRA